MDTTRVPTDIFLMGNMSCDSARAVCVTHVISRVITRVITHLSCSPVWSVKACYTEGSLAIPHARADAYPDCALGTPPRTSLGNELGDALGDRLGDGLGLGRVGDIFGAHSAHIR